jgi:pimeloyl-ACP methyl ester carboxylesterase
MIKSVLILASLLTLGASASVSAAGPAVKCQADYYRLADGTGVDIAPVDDSQYRWRRLDGTTGLLSPKTDGTWSSTLGWTGRADGKVVDLRNCDKGEIRFDGVAGRLLPLVTTELHFTSGGAELTGRLVLPAGRDRVPIVVIVHGSESTPGTQLYALQRLLPAQGVGAFVYDKRGTGTSRGNFTHDIRILAADAEAALETAKSTAGVRAGRVGYYGSSQGGWTVPLAATNGRADFAIVAYGLAVTPIDEDNEALTLDMTRHGFGPAEVAKALAIGKAAQAIGWSRFQSGYDDLRAVLDKYRREPWFRYVRGNITGFMISTPEAELRAKGPQLFPGIILDYDPMPVLRKLQTPQLWILGGDDIDAPYRQTLDRLVALRSQGRPIQIVIYPHVEHGLLAFETKGDERLSTQQPASLQRLLVTYAVERPLDSKYEDAQVVR